MSFELKNHQWCLLSPHGEWSLKDLCRNQTRPFYLYDLDDATSRAETFLRSGFSIHYAMKANGHGRLLREFAKLGLGADVVSLGELQRARAHGFDPQKIIFSGVAKDTEDLRAALDFNILQVNVESFPELKLLSEVARAEKRRAQVALRLNIKLVAPTHEHIQTATEASKFGIETDILPELLTWLKDHPEIEVKGIATHIGSQIHDLEIFGEMAERMGALYRELKSSLPTLERLDLGGGLGLRYEGDGKDDLAIAEKYLAKLKASHKTDAKVSLEPGRFLTARMGALLAKVIYIKETKSQDFAILNAGMTHLMRPALYEAYHRIEPVSPRLSKARYTVVGPICESTDKFATDREIAALERGDWVAVFDAGAYGAVMANTYNESPLPKELSVLRGEWEVE